MVREGVRRRLAFSCHRRHARAARLTTLAASQRPRCSDSRKHSEPTRRLELPSDGLRDRCTTVVLRGQDRAGDGSRTHQSQCGALTCHLDAPAWRCCVQHLMLESPSARAAASGDSNVVPPSGIEPEPLGLQPSAQTNYARVGYERRARLGHARRRSSSSFFDCQRAGCAGAPRALGGPCSRTAHLGRRRIRLSRGCTHRDSLSPIEISSRRFRLFVALGREAR